ncbi:DNA-3-methyladenine glycosylase 2 family protein [Loktanella sp. SALINAS62]|uniref:DNA-3-methyladenine glycosylase family protein n=1 Tax=Loktanella sp. SALINAS62 TaxID=2706124 RepID=UPI001B8D44A5|nr:DNA-3-methyladenine glycosylase 2 family protein [Loktanella sp. SALINAS62]MBS1303698.1 DNA-3-methyladenine glycosylase 2 family protein [Loktanella sp. SALINAS62]
MGQEAVTTGRIITGPDCVAEGAAFLAAVDDRMGHALGRIGPLPLRLKDDGFAALLSAICGQQVSVASASAIFARLTAAGMTDPATVAASDVDTLRALGLSRPKARYAIALAQAGINFQALRTIPTERVTETLIAVPGIGRWTAEIYAMFSLGRADVFASGDLALQEGARMLYDLPDRPTDRALRDMAVRWSPWRSVAARILWAYYALERSREGIR